MALAKIAALGKMPIIYTASEPDGSNGPIMEELAAAAPNARYVARKGEVSAWDNADFVKAVEATGRKTLVMAGVWTSVCVAFPALQAKAVGYKVYAVMDASGDVSDMATDANANVYITGKYGPSSNRDVFTRKLAAGSGATSFSKTFGVSIYDDARGIATLTGSEVYITGATKGPLAPPYRGGEQDGYVRKLNSGGTPVWTR